MTENGQQGWRRFVLPALIVLVAVVGALAFMGNTTDDSGDRASNYARCIADGGTAEDCR